MIHVADQDVSKVKSAAFALAIGWNSDAPHSFGVNSCMSAMRKTAIDTIIQFGFADDSVYDNLEKSYINNLLSEEPDYEEIQKTLQALAVLKTDKAINLLLSFLVGLNDKRNFSSWSNKENRIFPLVIKCLVYTKSKSDNIKRLLNAMQKNEKYTEKERQYIRSALKWLIGENISIKPQREEEHVEEHDDHEELESHEEA